MSQDSDSGAPALIVCGYEETKIDEKGNTYIVRCPNRYKSQKGRLNHIKEYHQKIRHFCPAEGCDKVYTRKAEMRKHFMKSHTGLEFEGYMKAYDENEKINKMTTTETDAPPDDLLAQYTCTMPLEEGEECGRSFITLKQKLRHMKEDHSFIASTGSKLESSEILKNHQC